jgi:DNA-binding HxlR family transcriptional regulator
MKKHYGCPIQATANTMSGKWKVLILWHLSFGQLRFSELRKRLRGVSEKVLAAQLRELSRDGLIVRCCAETAALCVDYRLHTAGQELLPVLEAMCAWGIKHLGVPSSWPPRSPVVAGADEETA